MSTNEKIIVRIDLLVILKKYCAEILGIITPVEFQVYSAALSGLHNSTLSHILMGRRFAFVKVSDDFGFFCVHR